MRKRRHDGRGKEEHIDFTLKRDEVSMSGGFLACPLGEVRQAIFCRFFLSALREKGRG